MMYKLYMHTIGWFWWPFKTFESALNYALNESNADMWSIRTGIGADEHCVARSARFYNGEKEENYDRA